MWLAGFSLLHLSTHGHPQVLITPHLSWQFLLRLFLLVCRLHFPGCWGDPLWLRDTEFQESGKCLWKTTHAQLAGVISQEQSHGYSLSEEQVLILSVCLRVLLEALVLGEYVVSPNNTSLRGKSLHAHSIPTYGNIMRVCVFLSWSCFGPFHLRHTHFSSKRRV